MFRIGYGEVALRSLLSILFAFFAVVSVSFVPDIAGAATHSRCGDEQGYYFVNARWKNPKKGGFVSHGAYVDENAFIARTAAVCGSASINEHVRVLGNSTVKDQAVISGKVIISGNAVVGGEAQVTGNVRVIGNSIVNGTAIIEGRISSPVIIQHYARINDGYIDSGRHGTKDLPPDVIAAKRKAAALAERKRREKLAAEKRARLKKEVTDIRKRLDKKMHLIVSRDSRPSDHWYLIRDGLAYLQNNCSIHVRWSIRVHHNPSGDVKNKHAWSFYETISQKGGEKKVSFKNGHLIMDQHFLDYRVSFKFIPNNAPNKAYTWELPPTTRQETGVGIKIISKQKYKELVRDFKKLATNHCNSKFTSY